MLPHLPDDARIWIFTADRTLASQEREMVDARLSEFLQHWASHGRAVPGGVLLQDDRFVVVAADLDGGVSGCGIDSLVHAVEAVGADLGIEWIDGLQIVYRDTDGVIQTVSRSAFRKMVREGTVTEDTHVFDTTLTSLGALRTHGIERPASQTWHSRVFHLLETA